MGIAPVLVLVGYVLLMAASPLRGALADGWRCMGRYPTVWKILGFLGFANALFQLAVKIRIQTILPPGVTPLITWMRPGWQDPHIWLHGSPDSLWWLPDDSIKSALGNSCLPALESVAGLFNNVVTTFPVAALAVLALLFNYHESRTLLSKALRKRYQKASWILMFAIGLCAAAVVLKCVTYFTPGFVGNTAYKDWAQLVEWMAFLFEYLFGVGVQIYLILFVYAWLRGISFEEEALQDVAIRRIGAAFKWATLVIVISSLLINVPLILSNFAWFKKAVSDESLINYLFRARTVLALFLIAAASVQAWLTLHGETFGRAIQAHFRFLGRHWLEMLWFLCVAVVHCYGINLLRLLVLNGLGENTAPGALWTLVWPWLAAPIIAWMLASWVCTFKRLENV